MSTSNDILLALGVTAELCGELKRQLLKNGFTRTEAIQLVTAFLTVTLSPNKNKEDK